MIGVCVTCNSQLLTDGSCPNCFGTGMLGQCRGDGVSHNHFPKSVPMQLGLIAGHCGKCGAPYTQDTYTGVLRPYCACWNIAKEG